MFSIHCVAKGFLGGDNVTPALNYACLQVKAIQLPCPTYPVASSLSSGSNGGTEYPSDICTSEGECEREKGVLVLLDSVQLLRKPRQTPFSNFSRRSGDKTSSENYVAKAPSLQRFAC